MQLTDHPLASDTLKSSEMSSFASKQLQVFKSKFDALLLFLRMLCEIVLWQKHNIKKKWCKGLITLLLHPSLWCIQLRKPHQSPFHHFLFWGPKPCEVTGQACRWLKVSRAKDSKTCFSSKRSTKNKMCYW